MVSTRAELPTVRHARGSCLTGVLLPRRGELNNGFALLRACSAGYRARDSELRGPERDSGGGDVAVPVARHRPHHEGLVEAPAYAGTDFIITRDGRIAAVYLFFDKLP